VERLTDRRLSCSYLTEGPRMCIIQAAAQSRMPVTINNAWSHHHYNDKWDGPKVRPAVCSSAVVELSRRFKIPRKGHVAEVQSHACMRNVAAGALQMLLMTYFQSTEIDIILLAVLWLEVCIVLICSSLGKPTGYFRCLDTVWVSLSLTRFLQLARMTVFSRFESTATALADQMG
jgi:hypothetical protein